MRKHGLEVDIDYDKVETQMRIELKRLTGTFHSDNVLFVTDTSDAMEKLERWMASVEPDRNAVRIAASNMRSQLDTDRFNGPS